MAGMKSINVEVLLNHSTGVSDSYYRPREDEILIDYLNAVEFLTINDNNEKIHREINELRKQNENSEYLVKSKLEERDDAIATLSDQIMSLMLEVNALKRNSQNLSD